MKEELEKDCLVVGLSELRDTLRSGLMMFEGAVMSTIQETGGDYGIQR